MIGIAPRTAHAADFDRGSLGLLVGGAAGSLPEPAARLIRIAQSNSQRLVRLIRRLRDR